MRNTVAALFAVALMVGSASASETADVVRTVQHFIDSVNKGDVKAALTDCAAQSTIIDEFPPYIWQGATGCADWSNDFDAYVKNNGITNPKVVLGEFKQIDVTGDRAYVVARAHFTFKQKERWFAENASIWTVALQKVANSWRITGWAWAKQKH